MPLDITVDPLTTAFVAYISIDAANTYMELNKLDSSIWSQASNSQKGIALTKSTVAINKLPFKGSKTVGTQDFEFPRGGDTSPPSAIESACAEIAFALIDGKNPEYDFESLRISKDKVSGIEITSDTEVYMAHTVAGIPSMEAWNLLLPYLRDKNSFAISTV